MMAGMNLLDLNGDVFAYILPLLSTATLRDLSETCHDAHNLTTPHLISSVILNRDRGQVSSFCRFMLANSPLRIPLLHSLTIADGACTILYPEADQLVVDVSFASLVADVVSQASNLIHLSISHTEDMIRVDSRIVQSLIHSCPRLTSVSFRRMGPYSVQMMRRLHSLRSATLDLSGDFSPVLRPFHLTLQNLAITGNSRNQEFLDLDLTWPHVRTLSIMRVFTSRARLARSFPNISRLEIHAETLDGYRMLHRNVENSTSWSHLDHVKGNCIALYFLGISCPIRHLELTDRLYSIPVGETSPWEPVLHMEEKYLVVIQATSPSVLSFNAEASLNTHFYTQLVPLVPRLRFLHLNIEEIDRNNETVTVLNKLPSILAQLPVVYLSLHCQGQLAPFQLSDLDFQKRLIVAFVRLVSSLQFIELAWEQAGWKCSWWESISRHDSQGREMVEISEYMGQLARKKWAATNG
ncbi:hypothetical protein JAAARDRAFT_603394 [Jaapia argillacea MUCL 33604]|uniref:F-box domain-containing protein n=1 Tax=Jaapia argillacea MUCL 33604 TaxID=933084 RepID=A0A067Q2G7_9AGAM|nr:hypothetical protein JAAARDRAFT_603394 [Jaapia argillacea MUCL 33604]